MSARRGVDATPYSAFVLEMRAAFREREAARTRAEKRAIQDRVEGIMRKHLGIVPRDTQAGAVDASLAAARVASTDVAVDRKLASVGPEAE